MKSLYVDEPFAVNGSRSSDIARPVNAQYRAQLAVQLTLAYDFDQSVVCAKYQYV